MKKIFIFLLYTCGCTNQLVAPDTFINKEETLKVLGVIAHPDDETSFSTTWFSLAKLTGGKSDLLVITNGEGGYKYSTLGEFIYNTELTEEKNGRKKLPSIRKKELELSLIHISEPTRPY